MEENIVRMDEADEIDTVDEQEESSESSSAGAFVAGVAGGVLAYAVISGTKKLAGIIWTKMKSRKKKSKPHIIEGDFEEVDSEQDDSSEETEEK